MRFSLTAPARPLSSVPNAAKFLLVATLVLNVIWQGLLEKPRASATALGMPPHVAWLRVASVGEPLALAQFLMLRLQAFDNQPGLSVPYSALDYGAVEAWLKRALELDPAAQYPLMMAAHLYAQIPDQAKQRRMLAFVQREFLNDPERRWRWLAHAALVAKHRLKDMPLALAYASDITRHAAGAASWARQMRIFILEDMGEHEAAAVLLGGLLATGEVRDSAEIHFLSQRLEVLKAAEKSSKPSEIR